FTNREGEIILKKYSQIGEMDAFASQFAKALAQISGFKVAITDRDQIIATAGGVGKDIIGKPVSFRLEKEMMQRKIRVSDGVNVKGINLTGKDEDTDENQVVYPVIGQGDVMGCVVIMGKDEKQLITQTEVKLAGIVASFLGKQMDD
ncbi:MAG: stage V sporulation protein T, partial [Lachnospiraceae bacterium]|nr:stage V sporulation protein T [Lachnospiraceae bacterium]